MCVFIIIMCAFSLYRSSEKETFRKFLVTKLREVIN